MIATFIESSKKIYGGPLTGAFTPDGQHTYLTKFDPYYGLPQVLVFGTGNSILLPGDSAVAAIAIIPDGKHAYVACASGHHLVSGCVDHPDNEISRFRMTCESGKGQNSIHQGRRRAILGDI
jgi:hypothetical protein